MKRLNPATQRSLFVRYHFKVDQQCCPTMLPHNAAHCPQLFRCRITHSQTRLLCSSVQRRQLNSHNSLTVFSTLCLAQLCRGSMCLCCSVLLSSQHEWVQVAFFNEFKHDVTTAIAHYKHAYDALASMKHPLGRIHEFKSISEILTFKVIQLQLANGEVSTVHFFRLIRDYR